MPHVTRCEDQRTRVRPVVAGVVATILYGVAAALWRPRAVAPATDPTAAQQGSA